MPRRALSSLTLVLLTFAFLTLCSCGDDDTVDAAEMDTADDVTGDVTDGDASEDADAPVVCEAFEPMPTGDPMGHAAPLESAAGEARAGVLTDAMLPSDPTELLLWRAGDYVLANDHVAVVIEGVRPSDGYDPYGGKIAGLARVEGGAMTQPASFNEIIPAANRFTVEPRTIGVLEGEGEDAGSAIVRVVGSFNIVPFIDPIISAIISGELGEVGITVDYVLAPDADTVEVRYTFDNSRPLRLRVSQNLLAFQKERMQGFVPETGFSVEDGATVPWIGFANDDEMSYAFVPFSEFDLLLEISGTSIFTGEYLFLEPCERSAFLFYSIVTGVGVDGLLSSFAERDDQTQREITGTVRSDDGTLEAGVHVHAVSADGETYLTRAQTNASGEFVMHVPMEPVSLSAYRRGDAISESVEVPTEVATASLTLAPHGFIEIVATDDDLAPLPVRVQILPASGRAPRLPSTHGEKYPADGNMHVSFPIDGRVTHRVPVGSHRVFVTHGTEYEVATREVSVSAGATTRVDVALAHVVDTAGVMCTDYHIHTSRSPDSPDSAEFKLRASAGDGLEIPCRSDHEWIVPFDDLAQEMGLGDSLYGVTSLELTTFAWGHFGVVPLEPDYEARNFGAPEWVGQSPTDVFDVVRARPEDPVLIINHPRGRAIGGYFSAAGYDPATGTVENPELWDDSFSVVEVFNSSSFRRDREGTVRDWFSLLNSGRRVFAAGSSDSHSVMGGSEVGYPRTCLSLGVDTPAELRALGPNAVRDATRAGQFYVSGGMFIDVSARDGVLPGGEVADAMPEERVAVRVQAPDWVAAESLEVFLNGVMVGDLPLTNDGGVVRFEDEVALEIPDTGAWVVFHARGRGDLTPVSPGRDPFAVSMPIFFSR